MLFFRQAKIVLIGLVSAGVMAFSAIPVMADSLHAEAQQQLNEQDVKAVLWMQRAAEYRALCYQAYNIAWREIGEAVAKHKEGSRPLAIVVDVDDTILDNTPLISGCVGTKWLAHDEQWSAWCHDEQAEPMPGAVEFLQAVDRLGVGIFYITGREAPQDEECSLRNLKRLKFPQISKKHVLMKKPNFSKPKRFALVNKDYDVILYMGDSMTDFPLGVKGLWQERNDITDKFKDEYGVKYILLPNPTYGGWENSLAAGYDKMPPQEKDAVRRAALQPWQTHDE